jgi:predicted dehydrogenase
MRTLRHTNTALDTGTATIRFCSGDELLLAWSWGLPTSCGGTRVFELLGPEGTMTWTPVGSDGQQLFAIHRSTTNKSDGAQAIKTETLISPEETLEKGFKRQMEEFVAVARGESTPQVDGVQGREALRVALAILQSSRVQEVVHLSAK